MCTARAGLALLALAIGLRGTPGAAQERPQVEAFVRAGCPHCAEAKRFLDSLAGARPGLRISYVDVALDTAGRRRLVDLARRHGVTTLGVPALLIRDRLIVGFDAAVTGPLVLELLAADSAGVLPRPPPSERVRTPLGELGAGELGLPLFTIAVGLVDGFNPCAMWALIYILSLLVNLRSRRRMAVVGGTFVLVGGALYFAFMAAWLEAFRLIGMSRPIQAGLGAVALLAAAVHIKDFVAFQRGFSLSIPDTAKPGLYAQMRRVLTAENLAGAVVAVAVLSALVNLVELLCTAGLPAVYTGILTARDLPRSVHYAYLGLYTAAYVFDDSLLLAVTVVTLSRARLQERGGRWLKLLSGVALAALGLLLLVRPNWLV